MQDEVFASARAFVEESKGHYKYGGYIYFGEGQELGQFWTKRNVGNAKLQKLPVIPALQMVTGITLSLVRLMVFF